MYVLDNRGMKIRPGILERRERICDRHCISFCYTELRMSLSF